MKVTVCFGEIKVVVPCGEGNLFIRELVEKAVQRYRTALGKNCDYWVTVHNFALARDGGILDWNDRVDDVLDDKELILAQFSDSSGTFGIPAAVPPIATVGQLHLQHVQQQLNGDAASGSSVGTHSPDGFYLPPSIKNAVAGGGHAHDVFVTSRDLSQHNGDSGLFVRSEAGVDGTTKVFLPSSPVLELHLDKSVTSNSDIEHSPTNGHGPLTQLVAVDGNLSSDDDYPKLVQKYFVRTSSRQSLGNSNPGLLRWLDSQDKIRVEDANHHDELTTTTNDCAVEATSFPPHSTSKCSKISTSSDRENSFEEEEDLVLVIDNRPGASLGITVAPFFDASTNQIIGLELLKINPEGRVAEDGRLRVQDRLLEVNGSILRGLTFQSAQEVLREAARAPLLQLRVRPYSAEMEAFPPPPPLHVLPQQQPSKSETERRKVTAPPPLLPKPAMLKSHGTLATNTPISSSGSLLTSTLSAAADEVHSKLAALNNNGSNTTVDSEENVNRTTRPPPPPTRSSNTRLSSVFRANQSNDSIVIDNVSLADQDGERFKKSAASLLPAASDDEAGKSSLLRNRNITNVRTIGRKLAIELVKGVDGLGFSVTSRDIPTAAGPNPIYVKNILKQGAAIRDGTLRAGDRLLKVDGLDLTGKQQDETVAILRAVPIGATVRLLVSRPAAVDGAGASANDGSEEEPELAYSETTTRSMDASGDFLNVPRGGVSSFDSAENSSQVLTFDIALLDSKSDFGGGGLGVSVKGRTGDDGSQDAGVFIKSIISGGAAFRDGRLEENDQLISINGESLTCVSNKQAMEVLRRNMYMSCEPGCGTVRLVIARQLANEPAVSGRATSTHTVDSMGSSGGQSVTINAEVHDTPLSPRRHALLNGYSNAIRQDHREPPPPPPPERASFQNNSAITYKHHTTSAAQALDENEASQVHPLKYNVENYSATRGGSSRSLGHLPLLPDRPPILGPRAIRRSRMELHMQAMQRRSASLENVLQESSTAVNGEYSAPGGPDTRGGVGGSSIFSREGVGRRSMSEKRHAHADAKQLDFYKQLKASQEEVDKGEREYSTLPSRLRAAAKHRQTQQLQQQQANMPLRLNMSKSSYGLNDYAKGIKSSTAAAFSVQLNGSTTAPTTPTYSRSAMQLQTIANRGTTAAVSTPVAAPHIPLPLYGRRVSPLIQMRTGITSSQVQLPRDSSGILNKALSMESITNVQVPLNVVASGMRNNVLCAAASCSDNELADNAASVSDASGSLASSEIDGDLMSGPMLRNRATNNSFRRAVDRSYEAASVQPLPQPPETSTPPPPHKPLPATEEKSKSSIKKKINGFFRFGKSARSKGVVTDSQRPSAGVSSAQAFSSVAPPLQSSAAAVSQDCWARPVGGGSLLAGSGQGLYSSAESRVLAWQAQNAAALAEGVTSSSISTPSPPISGSNDLNRASKLQALRANYQLAHMERGRRYPGDDSSTLTRNYESNSDFMYLNLADVAYGTGSTSAPEDPVFPFEQRPPPPPPPTLHRLPPSPQVLNSRPTMTSSPTRSPGQPPHRPISHYVVGDSNAVYAQVARATRSAHH